MYFYKSAMYLEFDFLIFLSNGDKYNKWTLAYGYGWDGFR